MEKLYKERRMKLIEDMATYISEYESQEKKKIQQMKSVLKKFKSKLKLTQPKMLPTGASDPPAVPA